MIYFVMFYLYIYFRVCLPCFISVWMQGTEMRLILWNWKVKKYKWYNELSPVHVEMHTGRHYEAYSVTIFIFCFTYLEKGQNNIAVTWCSSLHFGSVYFGGCFYGLHYSITIRDKERWWKNRDILNCPLHI